MAQKGQTAWAWLKQPLVNAALCVLSPSKAAPSRPAEHLEEQPEPSLSSPLPNRVQAMEAAGREPSCRIRCVGNQMQIVLLFSVLLLLFPITLLPSALLASVHCPGERLAVPTGGWHGVAGRTACAQRGSSLHVSHSPSVWGPSCKQQCGFEAFESPSIRTSEAFFMAHEEGKAP